MSFEDTPSLTEAIEAATVIIEKPEAERVELLHRMRQAFLLSRTVRGLNHLLEVPAYRPLGARALRTLGLEHAG